VARGQQVHRNGFEGRDPVWVKAGADTAFHEIKHEITDRLAHGGQRSEYVQISAEPGSYVYYQYATGRALLNDELSASLWVKASRPGVQFLGRLVLPHERNPNNLDDHLTILIRGDFVRAANTWQRLELRRPVELARKQQALMQATLKRPINIKDAFLDALVLNVYGGPGLIEVWMDDLEIGPMLDPVSPQPGKSNPAKAGNRAKTVALPRKSARVVDVKFSQEQLLVDGHRFLLRGIRHSDTPLAALREAGFNTVWVDWNSSPRLLQEAVDKGFLLAPSLPVTAGDQRLTTAENLGRVVSSFPAGDSVLFWDLGGALTYEQAGAVARSAQVVAGTDPGRPLGGDVWDGFAPYSRSLTLLGAHRWPLMTTLELPRYRDWLNQRRLLANPGTFMWTWVQTHLPEWYTNLVYERGSAAGFNEPIGPEPEQIILLTYIALASGCRGVGFWSDRFLADSHQGRDRLQVLALLNQELEMLEPLLVAVDGPPVWIDTSVSQVKAAVLRSPKAVLVLPMWLSSGAQFVTGQSTANNVSMVVPQVPQSAQAWEVMPGRSRSLKGERVPGGIKISLPEFALTSAVVFTSDISLVVHFQEQVAAKRKLAAQWTHDLAGLELAKLVKVVDQLQKAGHALPMDRDRIDKAQEHLRACEKLWENNLYSDAYGEAQWALRFIRVLMRDHWEKAVRTLDTPVASPYALSFYTLPRHWVLMDQIKSLVPGTNVLPNGDFELDTTKPMTSWVRQDLTLDDVELTARRVQEVLVDVPRPKPPAKPASSSVPGAPPEPQPLAPPAGPAFIKEKPKEGRQCLLLEIKPKLPANPPAALQRTYLGINTPPVKLPPGSWVQISGWVRIPKEITASADGALLYDSAGGEPLAIRITTVTPWKQFKVYRKVPPSGSIQVTMALTGLGRAYFDDIRIQPLNPSARPSADNSTAGK
jgi:hypothetical protein